ncbi:MAG: TonB family protein [Anaerolineae bacterium]|nr:TonB family protein [Anaerolineae bacterium]
MRALLKRAGLKALVDRSVGLEVTSAKFSRLHISEILASLANDHSLRYRFLADSLVLVEKIDAGDRNYSTLPFYEKIAGIASPEDTIPFPAIRYWEYEVVGIEKDATKVNRDTDSGLVPPPPPTSSFGLFEPEEQDEEEDVPPERKYFHFLNDLHKKVLDTWGGFKFPEGLRPVVVSFSVGKTGNMLKPKIFQSSGDLSIDKKALDSVTKAGPFLSLPDVNLRKIGIDYSFGGETEEGYIDFGPFMRNLQRAIKTHWYPPKTDSSNRVAVAFKVHSDGHISDMRIVQSSGKKQADEAGITAITKASSAFGPLPYGSPESVDILFRFDYNLRKGAGRGEFQKFLAN